MNVVPDGPTYELPLHGEVVPERELVTSRNLQLLSDKQFLCYGGVAIGGTSIKKTTVLNKSNQPCRVRLEIRSVTGEFQVKKYIIILFLKLDVTMYPNALNL